MVIKLTDAAEYWKGLPGQRAAFEFIQSRLSQATLAEFARLYRDNLVEQPAGDVRVAKILKRIKELGIKLEKPTADYKAYVVGIEGVDINLKPNGDRPDEWNDVLGVLKVYSTGKVELSELFEGTTEPGRYYVQNRMNRKGAAFVKTDMMHKDIWVVGRHKGQNNCLIQIAGPVTVVRDANNSHGRSVSDPVETGYFGINFHSTNGNYNPRSVSRWSAGCAVLPNPQEKDHLVNLCRKAVNTKYSYILLDGSKL